MGFEKNHGFFSKKETLVLHKFPKIESRTFWEVLIIDTIWHAFWKKNPRIGALQKSAFFYRKNHFFFRRRPKFWRFWEFLGNNLIWDAL